MCVRVAAMCICVVALVDTSTKFRPGSDPDEKLNQVESHHHQPPIFILHRHGIEVNIIPQLSSHDLPYRNPRTAAPVGPLDCREAKLECTSPGGAELST